MDDVQTGQDTLKLYRIKTTFDDHDVSTDGDVKRLYK